MNSSQDLSLRVAPIKKSFFKIGVIVMLVTTSFIGGASQAEAYGADYPVTRPKKTEQVAALLHSFPLIDGVKQVANSYSSLGKQTVSVYKDGTASVIDSIENFFSNLFGKKEVIVEPQTQTPAKEKTYPTYIPTTQPKPLTSSSSYKPVTSTTVTKEIANTVYVPRTQYIPQTTSGITETELEQRLQQFKATLTLATTTYITNTSSGGASFYGGVSQSDITNLQNQISTISNTTAVGTVSTSTIRAVLSAGTGVSYDNTTGVISATGGGSAGVGNTQTGLYAFSNGNCNNATNDYASASGYQNTASGNSSSAFGVINCALSGNSSAFGISNITLCGFASAFGAQNTASGDNSSAFGYQNTASGYYSSAFGSGNTASAYRSSAFGFNNSSLCNGSLALGLANTASGNYSSASGYRNTSTDYRSSSVGACNSASSAYASAFGNCNTASGNHSSAFGSQNIASGSCSLAFGSSNTALGVLSFANGFNNIASGLSSSASGYQNTASGYASSVFGYFNTASGSRSSAIGSNINNSVANSVQIGAADTDKLSVSANGVNFITSSSTTGFCVNGVAIGGGGGGLSNNGTGNCSIALGCGSTASGVCSSSFGFYNTASGNYSSAVGYNNTASCYSSSVSGVYNVSSSVGSSAFGYGNHATNRFSYASGINNTASGCRSSASGFNNTASGNYSSAFGTCLTNSAACSAQFGGTYGACNSYLTMNYSGSVNFSNGASITQGGTFTNASDRNLKENFTTLDSQDILSKINSLPITEWNYKSEDSNVKHIGPIAQDFYSLFAVGNSSTSISTIDPAGVALIGIQALSQRLDALTGSSTFASMSINLNSVATSSDSSMLSTLQSFGAEMVDGVAWLKEVFVEKLTVHNLNVDNTLKLKKGFIMESSSGILYCVTINDSGDFVKTPGNCDDIPPQTNPASTIFPESTVESSSTSTSTPPVQVEATTTSSSTSSNDTATSSDAGTSTEPVQ